MASPQNIASIVATAALLAASASTARLRCHAFTVPTSSIHLTSSSSASAAATKSTTGNGRVASRPLFASLDGDDGSSGSGALFFAEEDVESTTATTNVIDSPTATTTATTQQLFDESTMNEANDALKSVGWGGMSVKPGEEGELTSEDPFVKAIDESIRGEMGVGLDELLNPAKVVNLERDLYNLRNELATMTGAAVDDPNAPLTTAEADAGGGGEEADAIRAKILKKERDLAQERRAVFRSWLKTVFLGQAVLSMVLSYVMSTNPDAIFGSFGWYSNVANMDTSISVLGFWWWWLFIVPSLRSRRPTGLEKKALDIAFLGTPLVSLLSPVVTKDTGLIWTANFAVVAGSYGFAYLLGEDDSGDGGEDKKQPGWVKFVMKSLDFGSGRERGARR